MSWFLAFSGIALLIVLHEFGHFAAAKAVGMRVERFALFFPPMIFKVRRGETEYGVGAIPLGGYVKITGMSPKEDFPPEVTHRTYYKQPVWKRIVVIAAGPVMNIVVAFLILFGIFLVNGTREGTDRVGQITRGQPAAQFLQLGDRIVSVDGKQGAEAISRQIASHRCPNGARKAGCVAQTPAAVVVERNGKQLSFSIKPRYDAVEGKPRLGFGFDSVQQPAGPLRAARLGVDTMGEITTGTIHSLGRLFDAEKRKEVSGIVGSYEVTRQSFEFDTVQALFVIAIISLSLAIVNLFPFLPLDGGHIFWAVVEKIRGRAVSFSVMERSGVIGFALVIMLFVIGLSNDIGRLTGDGFNVR